MKIIMQITIAEIIDIIITVLGFLFIGIKINNINSNNKLISPNKSIQSNSKVKGDQTGRDKNVR